MIKKTISNQFLIKSLSCLPLKREVFGATGAVAHLVSFRKGKPWGALSSFQGGSIFGWWTMDLVEQLSDFLVCNATKMLCLLDQRTLHL